MVDGHFQTLEKISGGIKNNNNITEHVMEGNNLAWEQAQKNV